MSALNAADGRLLIEEAINNAEEFVPDSRADDAPDKPRLEVRRADPHLTVSDLREVLKGSDELFDRGVPVRLTNSQVLGGASIQVVKPEGLIRLTHTLCRPFEKKERQNGSIEDVNCVLPTSHAKMFLEWHGSWELRPLNGIASAPLLAEDGSISSGEGYDDDSGLWRENVPNVSTLVPDRPSKADALAALQTLRTTFRSFCFADASTVVEPETGSVVVNVSTPPGQEESAFLCGLLTAVCRPSLLLAPGILINAPSISGAGAGKGLLARCITTIAFGKQPHAVTAGPNREELEKRIAAELIQGGPCVFLDNLNHRAFKSDQLASAITERPARVRIFGKLEMVGLNSVALVLMTGNGLTVSEDLARRFIQIRLDPKTEDPEQRKFVGDIRTEVSNRRAELLAALLTIWRWGRQLENLQQGTPLGSFDQWGRWVRDPLLALGCQDPAIRISEAKSQDNRRQVVAEFFSNWHAIYNDKPVPVRDIDDQLLRIIDPQNRGRQFVASELQKMAGTRLGGFVLTRQAPPGKWGATTYAIQRTTDAQSDRGHRGHRTDEPTINVNGTTNGSDPEPQDGKNNVQNESAGPMPPTNPMPYRPNPSEGAEDKQTFEELI